VTTFGRNSREKELAFVGINKKSKKYKSGCSLLLLEVLSLSLSQT